MIDASVWEPKDGLKFDDKSLGIIKCDNNISIMAGPGAGKTEILAQKACFILETELCAWPYNVLSISRKRESASNIKNRVSLRCGNVLSERFHSFTIEAFTKSIVDRFMHILPKHEQPNEDYKLVFNSRDSNFRDKLTFDQLTITALKIVNSSSTLMSSIRATYKYVFIDEFQDLNGHQYDFVKSIFCGSQSVVTVVGDTKQAVMKFANALPDGFIKFKQDFKADLKIIYTNFRAAPELKQFIDCIGNEWWPINTESVESNIDSVALDKGDYSLLNFNDEEHEVKQLSLKIKKWISEDGIKPKEIAILFRINTNNNYSKNLNIALLDLGVLSINESNIQDYLSEPLGKVLVSLLCLLTRPRDIKAWECLRDSYLYCSSSNSLHNDFELTRILKLIGDTPFYGDGDAKTFDSILDVTIEIMNEFFYENLKKTWTQYRQGTLMDETFHGVLEELKEARNISSSWSGAVDLISGVGAVRMMTIHKSKGLEFEAVVLLGLEDYSYFRYGMTQKKLDEERSTVFVALSRAKSKLLISSAMSRKHTGPSKFMHVNSIINDLTKFGMNRSRVDKLDTLKI
ncbi:UvrD-helicase domain-containing protein [Photobacterium profundum]|uniref:DNA 3'-5' helicase n=1 Tax=Photobacterium profundum (strain SS9) TaxID=298386 RepID=Q6LWD2_PHOPR|nr:ATP-dependent helicase [Photobacterium profundum]CAG17982.1 putative helicase [Photobacterium profundum SS9]